MVFIASILQNLSKNPSCEPFFGLQLVFPKIHHLVLVFRQIQCDKKPIGHALLITRRLCLRILSLREFSQKVKGVIEKHINKFKKALSHGFPADMTNELPGIKIRAP